MPDRKITDLVDGAPLQAADEFVVARAGDNFKIDGAEVVAAVTKHDVTLAGNTAGVLALISSGTMTLAGGNNITLSQAGNAVTISGGGGAETQTFIGGISASDTLYTSGTVRFTGSQAVTVRSGTGQLVVIDVPTQSVQPETQTFVGGISASDTLYTSGTVRITGVGGGVTVSSNTGQRVDISVAAQSVQPETQTFIGGISASDTLYTSGSVRFTGVGGGITVSSNTGQRVDLSVAAQSVQPETQTFVGGIGNSQTTYTSGTVNLSVVAGQLTIRSTTGQAFQFSASQSVQVETQTFLGALANSETTYTSGSVTLSALGAITVRSTTGQHFQLSVNSQTVQTQNAVDVTLSGNTAGVLALISSGTMTLAGGNNIVLSQAGNAVTISASSQSVQAETQTFVAGIANSETTYTSGTVTLSVVGGNLTIRSTTGQAYQFSASQTVQTQDVLSVGVSTGGNTSGNTTVNTGSQLVFAGGNNITLSQGTAAGATTITISAPNLGAGAFSGGASTGGNTAGATGITGTQLVFVGSGVVSLSQTTGANGGTLSILAPATSSLSATGAVSISTNGSTISIGAPVATNFSAGLSTGGNTAGATGITGTRLVFVGTNNISLSQTTDANGGTISINNTASNYSAGMSTQGNTAGSTGVTGTRLVLVGTNAVSLSQATDANGGTLSINVTQPVMSYSMPASHLLYGVTQGIGASAATQTTVTAFVMPLSVPAHLAFNNLFLAVSNNFSSATTSISSINYSYSQGASLGFYTLNDSTMSLVTSFSGSLGFTNATSANATDLKATGIAGWGGSSQSVVITGAANMSSIMSSISGARKQALNWSTNTVTLTANQYWAVACFTQLTGGNAQASLSSIGFVSSMSVMGSAWNPPAMMRSTASVTSPYPFLGQATLVNSSNSLMPISFNTNAITVSTATANSTKFQSIWFQMYRSHSD